MTNYRLFLGLTVLALALSNAVYQVAQTALFDIRSFLTLCSIYGVSVFCRSYLYSDATTFFDFDHRGLHKPKEDLIIFGNRVDDLAEQSKERRVLIDLLDFGGHRYRIYIAWVLSLALTLFISFRYGGFYLVSGAVSILTLSAIYFSPFIHQLLIPLFLSFALSLYGLFESRSLIVVILFLLYLFSFVMALLTFRETDADRANTKRRIRIPKLLVSSLSIVALLSGIYFIVDRVLPEKSPFAKSVVAPTMPNVAKPRVEALDGLSRDIAEQILKWQEKRGESTGGEPRSGGGPSGDGSSDGGDGPKGRGDSAARGESKSREGGGAENSRADGGSRGDRSQRAGSDSHEADSRGGDGPPSASARAGDGIKPSGRGDISQSGGRGGGEPRQGSGAPNDDLGGKGPMADTSRSDKSGGSGDGDSPQGNDSRDSANQQAQPQGGSDQPSGANSDSGKSSQTKASSKESPSTPEAATSSPKTPADREKKLKELQNKVKLPLEVMKGLLFIAVAIAALLALAKFFSSSKDEPEKQIRQQLLTQRQKQKLQAILGKIRAKNSPAEVEVVETYNALLMVFETGLHSRESWLPAEDFSRQIAKALPSISKDFGEATNRFATTLYGQKPVAREELETFRGHVGKVLRFFQLS